MARDQTPKPPPGDPPRPSPMEPFDVPRQHESQVDPWSLSIGSRGSTYERRTIEAEPGAHVQRMGDRQYRLVLVKDFPTKRAALEAAASLESEETE